MCITSYEHLPVNAADKGTCVKTQVHKGIPTIEGRAYINLPIIYSQVMPSYISHGWKVKKPFSDLVPEVDAQGEQMELSGGKTRRVKETNKNNGRCEEERKQPSDL